MAGSMEGSQTESQLEEARKRQELSRQYRSWVKRAECNKGALEDPANAQTLVRMVKDLNVLHGNIKGTKVMTQDSNAFSFITDRGVRMAQKLNEGSQGLTIADLLQGLRARYGEAESCDEEGCLLPDAFNWQRLGALVGPLFRAGPGFSCLLGPLAQEPKAAVKRTATQREKKTATPLAELVNPEERDTGAEENTTETTRDIELMYTILRSEEHKGGVPLLRLYLDHDSFSKTVENLFALSFLVRDGRAELREVTAGGEYRGYEARVAVPPPRQPGGAQPAQPSTTHLQFILSYDMDDWEDWKQACARSRTLMPSRAESHRAPHPQPASRAGAPASQRPSAPEAAARPPKELKLEGVPRQSPSQAAKAPPPLSQASQPKRPRTKLGERQRVGHLGASQPGA